MKKLAQLQLAVICLSWFVAFLFSGVSVAISVLLGGLTYFLPTVLAIVVLQKVKCFPESLPMLLLVVEVHKILLAVMIMIAIYFLYPSVYWMSYVIGLILVTQVGLLMFRRSFYYE